MGFNQTEQAPRDIALLSDDAIMTSHLLSSVERVSVLLCLFGLFSNNIGS